MSDTGDRFDALIDHLEGVAEQLRTGQPQIVEGVALALKYARAFRREPPPGALQGDGE